MSTQAKLAARSPPVRNLGQPRPPRPHRMFTAQLGGRGASGGTMRVDHRRAVRDGWQLVNHRDLAMTHHPRAGDDPVRAIDPKLLARAGDRIGNSSVITSTPTTSGVR
jgi:hypothetical protein